MARLTPRIAPAVIRLGTVDSTQRQAAALARRGAPDRTVVVADTQTAGRGRRGRPWHDAPAASLLMSMIVRSALPPPRLPTLSIAAGLAVVDALAAVGLRAQLKWPNDALVQGRKIAGVLLERSGEAVIVGIGINVDRAAVPAALAEQATSVAHEGGDADRDALLEALLGAVDRWRERLEGGDWEGIRRRWSEVAATLGRDVSVDGVAGRATGLDHDGALLLATAGGLVRVVAGDVASG